MSNNIANSNAINVPVLSAGYDYNLWCKRMYEYLVLTHGSEAAEFMNPNGTNTWWQPPTAKLNVISKSLQDFFTKSVKSSKDYEPPDYAEDFDETMFFDVKECTIVPEASFKLAHQLWIKELEEGGKEQRKINAKKPAVWITLEKGISTAILNDVKEKSKYKESLELKNVEWFAKTVKSVFLTEQVGIPEIDFVRSVKALINCNQGDSESLPKYLDRFHATFTTYQHQCLEHKQTAYSDGIIAALFMTNLGKSSNEFISTTTNWVKSNVCKFPKTYTDVYQSCATFKPIVDKKSLSQIIESAGATGTDGTSKRKSENLFVSESKTSKPKDKETKHQRVRDRAVTKEGMLQWKDTGARINCKTCNGNHFTFDHVSSKDESSTGNKKLLQEVKKEVAEGKSNGTPATSKNIFLTLEHIYAAGIGSNSLLLDSEATIGAFNRSDLFLPGTIRKLKEPITLNGVSGPMTVEYEGDTKNFGTLLYDSRFPCQILSFYKIWKMYDIESHKFNDHAYFRVHLKDGTYIDFVATDNLEMFVHELDLPPLEFDNFIPSCNDNSCDASSFSHVYVTTVADNKLPYTKDECRRADEALALQTKLAFASDRDVHKAISFGAIDDLPVTNKDFHRARMIYGPSIPIKRGKTKHKSPEIFKDNLVPSSERKCQSFYSDIFFVAGIPFLLSIIRPLDHCMCNQIRGRTAADIVNAITPQVRACTTEGFQITVINFDGESCLSTAAPVIYDTLQVPVIPSPSKEPIVERKIQTIKGRIRSVIFSLPFALCRTLLVMCVLWCVSRINMVPSSVRADNVSSFQALTGRRLNYRKDLYYSFLDYTEQPVSVTSNSATISRTVAGLAVQSTGNSHGDFKFFNPYTRKYFTRCYRGAILPYPESLIEHMNKLAIKDGLHDVVKSHIPQFSIGKPDGDDVVLPPDEITDDDHYVSLLDEQLHDEIRDPMPISSTSTLFNSDPIQNPIESELRGVDTDNVSIAEEYGIHNLPSYIRRNPIRNNRKDMNPNWKGYSYVATQYTRRQAQAKFGALAVKAKMKELIQLDDKDVLYPVDFFLLNKEQRKRIIRSHVIYSAKYDDNTGEFIKLKARFVGNGSTQNKELYDDVSSPTVTTHAVMINAAIAAKEGRKVKTVDIPGAYLNADMSKEEVYMSISPDEAEILVMLKPEYRQFLRSDGSMVVKLNKALYGCIESAKLWYEELKTTLVSIGYIANPKDICVFNKVVNDVQCTITLHVDDLMITSINEKLIDEVLDVLKLKYSKEESPLTVKEGNIHNYLGMTFDFSIKGKVSISMNKYITDLLLFSEVKGSAATPATEHLYIIDQSPVLNVEHAEYFHSIVAKLLYLAKRVRPDLLTAVGFLAKRVKEPTQQDNTKLDRVLKYLNHTPDLGLVLKPNDNLSVLSFIDASYAVHNDMKSQTGVAITFGEGVTLAKSTTQQLNSKSSTEAELIALTDASGHVIWVRDYLINQGYNIGPVTIYQDNKSTMALVKKGYSTANNTRHINIRYFFIKDRVEKQELKIEYLPTEDMIADFFTKPLQGELFKKLRDKILGITSDQTAYIMYS